MRAWAQGDASVCESDHIDRSTNVYVCVCLSHAAASLRCGQRTRPDPSGRTAAPAAGTG